MKTFIYAIGLVGLTAALCACGGGDGGSSPAASTPPPSSQPPPSSEPEAVNFTTWMQQHASPSSDSTAPTAINDLTFNNVDNNDPNTYNSVLGVGS